MGGCVKPRKFARGTADTGIRTLAAFFTSLKTDRNVKGIYTALETAILGR